MTEPRTAAGKALDKYMFHERTCSKQPTHPDRKCTCGWTERILAIETEAAADLLALHKAADAALWHWTHASAEGEEYDRDHAEEHLAAVLADTAPAAQAIKERIVREAVKPWRSSLRWAMNQIEHFAPTDTSSVWENDYDRALALLAGTEGEKP